MENRDYPVRKWVRLREYDYRQSGAYFITIVSHNRRETFGRIDDGEVTLTQIGNIVKRCWRDIPFHFENIAVDVFVVMPNHIHGIIGIQEGSLDQLRKPSLANIVSAYKAAVTRNVRALPRYASLRVWQNGYYDHVIRDDRDFQNAVEYIENNPLNWHLDKENSQG